MHIVLSPINLFREPILSTSVIDKNFKDLNEIISFCESNPLILKTLKDSNPAIIDAINKYKNGETTKRKKIRNLTISLQNYLLRMGTRTTPFRYMTKIGLVNSSGKTLTKKIFDKSKYIARDNCEINISNKSKIKLKITSLFLKRQDNLFIENTSENKNSMIIKDTLLLQFLRSNLKNWEMYSKIYQKVKVEFQIISEDKFIAYLNKLIQIGFICCSEAANYEEEPTCAAENLEIAGKGITDNVKVAIDFLTYFLDTKQEYKGWAKLKNYFSENYLFERVPLTKVIYTDEFNGWDNDEIEYHKGKNYTLLEDFITSQIMQNKTKIDIPEELFKGTEREFHHNMSGDLLVSIMANKLILDSGIGSSSEGKIIGRFIQIYPTEERKKVINFLNDSLSDNEISAEVRYLFKDHKFAAISNNINPYKYEINLNSIKDDSKYELAVDSLSVGLDDKGIYLWSEDLHKKVIPRFTNSVNGLAVNKKMYRFLFLLSKERYESFKPVIPEYLENRIWSPRLEYKGIIIRREQWKLDSKFNLEQEHDFKKAINNWRSRYNVPKIVGVSFGEAPTVFDLDNDLHLQTLKKIIHKNDDDQINFVEIPEITERHNANIIQGVFSFYVDSMKNSNLDQYTLSEYREDLDELTYSNGFLSFILYPSLFLKNPIEVIYEVLQKAKIDKHYFFIQYNDNNKPSLRLRVWKANDKLLTNILNVLDQLLKQQIIDDFELVNFRPEYSRYGGKALFSDVLQVFEVDSRLALMTINMSETDNKLFAILSAISVLEKANIDFEYLAAFILTKKQIISKHSSIASQLNNFKKETHYCNRQNIDHYSKAILKYVDKVRKKYADCKPKYYSVLASLLHMHFNRFLKPTEKEENQVNLEMLEYEKIKTDKEKYDQVRKRNQ